MNQLCVFQLIFVLFWSEVTPQQCRQIRVCDEDNVKGQKGEVGFPGKQGLKGDRGCVGEKGLKGMQGDSCALGEFGNDLRNTLKGMLVNFFVLTSLFVTQSVLNQHNHFLTPFIKNCQVSLKQKT